MEDILCNNIKVLSFVNTPVPSNTFLLVREDGHCIVIDPGTKEQTDVCDYIQFYNLTLDLIILTHEHFDHCWGVNYLHEYFPASKVVATQLCAEWIQTPMNYFNQLYYNSDEMYQIEKVHVIVEDVGWKLMWGNVSIVFVSTPGHTDKSMCVEIGGCLFTGDTLLYHTKPFLKKRYGASKLDLKNSIEKIYHSFLSGTKVFPGHGEPFVLKDARSYYVDYFK